jgi:hypothetical protein
MANTVEELNVKSQVVVYNSDVDLVNKKAVPNTQGVAVEDVAGYEKISYGSNPNSSLTTSRTGESIITVTGGGVVKRFICLGGYGSTLRKGTDLADGSFTGFVNSTDADDTAGTDAVLSGGSGAGATATYVVTGGTGDLDSLILKKTATGYKAGDVLSFTPTGASTAVTITLSQADLNQAEWYKTDALTQEN